MCTYVGTARPRERTLVLTHLLVPMIRQFKCSKFRSQFPFFNPYSTNGDIIAYGTHDYGESQAVGR